MNEKEKNAIEYLKTRLYGNECCKYIDIAQEDLRIFVNLIEKTEKNINSWKKYSDEQEENVIEKNNNICNLEFQIEKLQKENEELKFKEKSRIIGKYEDVEIHDLINRTLSNDYIPIQKVKDKIEEYKNMLKTCNKAKDIDRIKAINERILELQELLEGRK